MTGNFSLIPGNVVFQHKRIILNVGCIDRLEKALLFEDEVKGFGFIDVDGSKR